LNVDDWRDQRNEMHADIIHVVREMMIVRTEVPSYYSVPLPTALPKVPSL